MAFVWDQPSDASDLVLWRADDIAAGPVCRIAMPRRVPEGLHGNWLATSELPACAARQGTALVVRHPSRRPPGCGRAVDGEQFLIARPFPATVAALRSR